MKIANTINTTKRNTSQTHHLTKQSLAGSFVSYLCSMKTLLKVVAVVIFIMLSVATSFALGRRGLWGGRMNNLTRHFAATAGTIPTTAAFKSSPINHPSYDKVEDFTLPEYGLTGSIYAHRKSGAQVISLLAPEDNNKVFGITFRTPPKDR